MKPLRRREFVQNVTAGLGSAAFSQAFSQNVKNTPKPDGKPTTWFGSVTDSSAIVKAKLPAGGDYRLAVRKAGGSAIYFKGESYLAPAQVTRFRVTGLEALTEYQYAVEIGGKPSTFPPGTIRTMPRLGAPASFAFAFSSCCKTGSQHPVFTSILDRKPTVFLHLGDFHYANIPKGDPALYRAAWDTVLSSTTQAALYRSVPLEYVWDDHDFGPNGSHGGYVGRPAACAVYREYAPVDALPENRPDGAVYHAFSIGRARFIMTDLRSMRSPDKDPDGPAKTMMGAEQKAWFKNELRTAAKSAAIVFWASSVPWIGAGKGDSWATYGTERTELAKFMAEIGIKNLCILCGDAHMVAADDGRNSDYSGTGKLRIPVLHGSALDQKGSMKGGPYSEGSHISDPGEGCFGWVQVTDQGGRITVDFTGQNHLGKVHVKHRFEV